MFGFCVGEHLLKFRAELGRQSLAPVRLVTCWRGRRLIVRIRLCAIVISVSSAIALLGSLVALLLLSLPFALAVLIQIRRALGVARLTGTSSFVIDDGLIEFA
jgi:hypothetical protein